MSTPRARLTSFEQVGVGADVRPFLRNSAEGDLAEAESLPEPSPGWGVPEPLTPPET